MGRGLGKLPVVWNTGNAVVGSHGPWIGEAACGLEYGQCSCWFSWAVDWESCLWFGIQAMQLLVVGWFDPVGVTRYWKAFAMHV